MATFQPSYPPIPLPYRNDGETVQTTPQPALSQSSSVQTRRRSSKAAGRCTAGVIIFLIFVVIKICLLLGKSKTVTYSIEPNVYTDDPYWPPFNPTTQRPLLTPILPPGFFVKNVPCLMNESCDANACDRIVDNIINSINESVDPCDNFYDYACQGWHERNPRPEFIPEWSVFSKLRRENTKRVIRILEKPGLNSSSEQKPLDYAKIFYKKCILIGNETSEVEDNVAIKLMLQILQKQGGWPILYKKGIWYKSRFDWISSTVHLKRQFQSSELLDVSSYQYPNWRKKENTIYIKPPSPSSSSLEAIDKLVESKKIFQGFETLQNLQNLIVNISKVFLLFQGKTDIDETYLNDQAYNTLLLQIILPRPGEPFNKLSPWDKLALGMEPGSNVANTTLSKIQKILDKSMYPFQNDLELPKLLQALYKTTNVRIRIDEPVVITDVAYLLNMAKFITETKEDALANYLSFRMILLMIPLSGHTKLMNLLNDFENGLSGTKGVQGRNELCAEATQQKFHVAVGHEFVQTEVDNNELEFEQAQITFSNLKVSLQKLIQSSDKPYLNKNFLILEAAITSLCLGYPSWMNGSDEGKVQSEYKGLELKESATFLEQNIVENSWAVDKSNGLLRQPLTINDDSCQWTRFPGYVGAYNAIIDYSVYLPVGIMQLPFYNIFMPMALVYGKLGSILGHEITHGLAGPGWSELQTGGLTPSGKCLVNQYGNFTTPALRKENVTLNGMKTLEENIPDNAGLLGAYKAFKASTFLDSGMRKLEALNNFTDDQLFFLGFAQNWCETTTPKALRNSMKNDDHAPGMFRVLGSLQNSKEFAAAWKCPLGSNMNPFLADNRKCNIF